MKYGHFSDDGREFIIDNVETPSPWINYMYNGEYFSTISNNGGGISYHKNPLHGRITRYRINDVPHDRPGKYIYIKDQDSGEIWSLTWQPVGKHKEAYQVAHGFAYTRVTSEIAEIASSVLFFVPPDDNQEIWKCVLNNKSNRTRKLSIFGYVEFALGHALVDLINQCDDQHFNRVYFDPAINALFATKTYWVTESRGTQHQENKAWDQWAFFTANLPISHYETVREKFIGLYRNENNPIAIENGDLSSQNTDFGNTVGALQIDLEIPPGESKDVIFSLGIIPKNQFDQKKRIVPAKYKQLAAVETAYEKVIKKWNIFFKNTWVNTPDKNTNIFMNYWTPYQAQVAFDVGRVASFYYWGIGRGFGFRDTSQDTIAVTISEPEKAKARIEMLARQIFSDGHVYHHFYNDGNGETTGHCDDPMWFILAVTDYLKETGDISLLDQVEPFVDQQSGTIIDHLMAVANFAKNNLGKHGLPIFGRGDWNDTLDYIGGDDGGESVWGGMFYVTMLNYLIELLNFIGLENESKATEAIRDQIKASIKAHCWDGEWFIRAFGANDRKIGSKESEFGKIFLNSQIWAVMAQIGEKDQLITALDSVRQHLDTEYGPKICAPAFNEIDPSVGLVTRCVIGKKENGAIFYHPTAWLIQAECMLGRGNIAYEYYQKLLPNSVDSDIYVAEPYVYSQYITSDEHDQPGRASHSWQTGTAAWMYRIALDYILGVRAGYSGLVIDPVIPYHWKQARFERKFRGCRYIIDIKNPDAVERGIKQIFIDDQKIEGNVLPILNKKECRVTVRMG